MVHFSLAGYYVALVAGIFIVACAPLSHTRGDKETLSIGNNWLWRYGSHKSLPGTHAHFTGGARAQLRCDEAARMRPCVQEAARRL